MERMQKQGRFGQTLWPSSRSWSVRPETKAPKKLSPHRFYLVCQEQDYLFQRTSCMKICEPLLDSKAPIILSLNDIVYNIRLFVVQSLNTLTLLTKSFQLAYWKKYFVLLLYFWRDLKRYFYFLRARKNTNLSVP